MFDNQTTAQIEEKIAELQKILAEHHRGLVQISGKASREVLGEVMFEDSCPFCLSYPRYNQMKLLR